MELTHDEKVAKIKGLVGTEFTYDFGDGDVIPAIIAAFDPKIGFTCLATGVIDSSGYDHSDNLDKNGNLCLVGIHANRYKDDEMLDKILDQYYDKLVAGEYTSQNKFGGNAFCSF